MPRLGKSALSAQNAKLSTASIERLRFMLYNEKAAMHIKPAFRMREQFFSQKNTLKEGIDWEAKIKRPF
jgi:hypothetical protein